MSDAGFFRGTSADQDNRFSDKEKKLLKQMKFEDALNVKVDTTRVKLDVLKPWIGKRVAEFIGMEDDVVVEFIFNQLEAKDPDPRKMQINLTGFLNGKNARVFMGELWKLLDSAQNNESGIPQEMIDKKKEEIKNRREAEDRVSRVNESLKKLSDADESRLVQSKRARLEKEDRRAPEGRKRKESEMSDEERRVVRRRSSSREKQTKEARKGDRRREKEDSDEEELKLRRRKEEILRQLKATQSKKGKDNSSSEEDDEDEREEREKVQEDKKSKDKKQEQKKKKKRTSKSSEEESEDEDGSEEEKVAATKKKKEKKDKKRKKHKKNKKHKKHKKHREDSSADDEDLEKKLRERALNSMKKKAAKEAKDDSEEESSSE